MQENSQPVTEDEIIHVNLLGLVLKIGITAEKDIAGPNVWYRITGRDEAISAIRYKCDEGSPHLIVRIDFSFGKNEEGQVVYEIGGFSYQPPSATKLPDGIIALPRRLRIDPNLIKAFIAEGLVSPENTSQYQQHMFWTDSAYFKSHRDHILRLAEEK